MATKDDVIKNQEKEILRLREKLENMSLEKCAVKCVLARTHVSDFAKTLKSNLMAQGIKRFSLSTIEEIVNYTLNDYLTHKERTDTKWKKRHVRF